MSDRQATSTDKIIVDRSKRKSAASQMISEGRKLAATNAIKPLQFEIERLATYAENHYNARFALPVLVFSIAAVSALWSGAPVALYWSVVAFLAYGVLISIADRFRKSDPEETDLPAWRRRFHGAQLLVAFAWTMFAIIPCMACDDPITFTIIQFSALLLFQAITMMLSHSIGSFLLVTSAPPTIVFALTLVLSLDVSNIIMGGILVASQVFFYLIADRLRISILSSLTHRHEREALIAELVTARAMSEEARRRAEGANLAKSRFLATMSHELRTPLNAILGFSEVMKTEVLGPLGNDTYQGYVSDIHASGSHLLNVINEILDLSRIEAGRYELREEALKLSSVVSEAIQMVALKAKTKSVEIDFKAEQNLPGLWADERSIRQVTLNLLSNALKFTPSGGQISVEVGWTSRGGQYVSIRDTGPGIPESEIPVVLSSFGQGSIAIKSAEQGTGLGLPIVQALVEMHGGKFDLKSTLRKGTTVIASFPRNRVLDSDESDPKRTTPMPRRTHHRADRRVS